ncbi:cytochrome P450 [Mycena sp. CBHHK59/15]|nr:cytochrome P450 [Mycena sp. CBHHK59/15]
MLLHEFAFLSLATLRDLVVYYALYQILKWLLRPFYSNSPLREVPGPLPQSWFKGNLGQLFSAKGLPFHRDLVARYGGMVKVYGFFGDEQLYISDPHALHRILIKDQDAYEETSVFVETNNVIFGPGLVSTIGDIHKRQRRLVQPIFSPSNLRDLVPVFYAVAERLSDVLGREIRSRPDSGGSRVLDMSEWLSRAALESAGQAILGYSFDPLDSPVNNPYTNAVRELIPKMFSLSLVRQFAPFLVRMGPPWFRRKLVEWTPNEAVQRVKEMSDVMHETAQSILSDARKGLLREMQENTDMETRSKDVISLLLRANQNASDAEQLRDAELTGQMTVMIFGAQDTSASALSRIMYILSIRPDIQEKVRAEFQAAHISTSLEDRLSWEAISALPMLDAVLKETLRLYPPVPFVRRTATAEVALPFTSASGIASSVVVPRGTTLFVCIAGANRLKSVWGPDAEDWKPERWLKGELHHKVDPDIRLPGVFAGTLSFLGGARSCVGTSGYKFAQIEIKIILVALLSRFRFSATQDDIVWNLSQIISPSVRTVEGGKTVERKGLPLQIKLIDHKHGYSQ